MKVYTLSMWLYIEYVDILIFIYQYFSIIIIYLKNKDAFEIFRIYLFEVS